jgi:Ricin-type beta-trefoil lectin domain
MAGTQKVRRKLKLFTSRRWRVGLAALLPVSALLAGVLTASPASADDTWYFSTIQSAMQGGPHDPACLDDWNWAQNNYAIVVAYPCNANDKAQQWALDITNDTIHPTDANGNPVYSVCLDVYADAGPGANVDLYQCNHTDAQLWFQSTDWIRGEYSRVVNYNAQSEQSCLDIPNYGNDVTPPGGPPTQLHVWTCNTFRDNGAYQQWQSQ